MYEFNTQSGARRWKKSNEPLQPTAALQVRSSATGDGDQETDRAEVPSKKETSEKRKEPREAARPSAGPSLSPGQDGLEVPKQKGEPEDRELPSSAQQHRHWLFSLNECCLWLHQAYSFLPLSAAELGKTGREGMESNRTVTVIWENAAPAFPCAETVPAGSRVCLLRKGRCERVRKRT